ncbi:MAG: hypothetical protein ACKOZX_09895 [Gammaproteobacteria bacterium]
MGPTFEAGVTPGILPSALRARLRLFQIAPGDSVKIDILTCEHCGGPVKVIASIENPVVIKKILNHLARRADAATPAFRPFARAPPQQELPGLKEPG